VRQPSWVEHPEAEGAQCRLHVFAGKPALARTARAMLRVQELASAWASISISPAARCRPDYRCHPARFDFSVEGTLQDARELEKGGAKVISEDENCAKSNSLSAAITGQHSPRAMIIMCARARAPKSAGPPSWRISAGAISP